ncbi:MAG: carbohydrate ABC transporter permease [Spirochaetaceae bacterium]|jgi:multiple sugar transport system permease protein|nr:carbohydrate ABC transporter permease [Spirochaetaceae bacterium]
MKKQVTLVMIYAVLIAVFCLTFFPVFYTFMASFKSNREILTTGNRIIPEHFVTDNYVQAWKLGNFKRYTFNSIYMAVFIVAGVIVNSIVSGYCFARGRFFGKQVLYYLILSSMFVSLGSLTLYPLLMITKVIHLNRSLWGVIIIRIFATNTTNLFIARSYIEGIPTEIDQAAKIDGCSFFQIFRYIISPLCVPIVATVGILTFRSAWNDYLLPMVFTIANPNRMPLIVGVINLKSTGESASAWNLMLAGTAISLIPMIIVYIAFNRYFIEGLTSGSVKG